MLPEWNKTKSKLKNKKINIIDIEQQEMYKLFKFNSDNKLMFTGCFSFAIDAFYDRISTGLFPSIVEI